MPFKRVCQPITSREGAKSIREKESLIDFSSNDYLGYSQHPQLLSALQQIPMTQFGSTGSRLLGGDYDVIHQLEDQCASVKHKQAALFFNSGYQMNIGIFEALCSKDDLIIADKLSHASLIDGALKSPAKLLRFKHNDLNHLDGILNKHRSSSKNCWIVSETLFSMDGDFAPIDDLIELKTKYNAKLCLDDAHAFGILGDAGIGGVSKAQAPNVDLILATFGKALGSSGAFVACDSTIKDQLINHCRSFMFSTALPLPIIHFNQLALEQLPNDDKLRQEVAQRSNAFRKQLTTLPVTAIGDAHILPLIVGDEADCKALQEKLKGLGVWVQSIRYPTVPKGQARLRFSITSNHTEDIIKQTLKALHDSL